MASNVISETYLVVAAVIAASVLGGAITFGTMNISDSMKAAWLNANDRLKTSVEAIFAFGNPDGNIAHVFVKNTGKRSFQDGEIRFSDVFFGPRGSFARIPFRESGSPPRWTYTIVNDDGDNVWEPGETIKIEIYWTSNLGSSDYYFRFVTPFGRSTEIVFTTG